ncbi:START domain-containing protein 10 [Podila verticillata]|nr:START domain-containing protein 10 [Podila verticillata]
MVETTQSPLAMLVLITPYTLLYFVNELFLHGILDKVHYLFFELIFVLAFRKIFGIPDLTERFFPSASIHIQATESVQPLKTHLANTSLTRDAVKAASEIPCGGVVALAPSEKLAVKSTKENVGIERTTTTATTTKEAKSLPPSLFAKELEAMEKKFFDYYNNTEIWEKAYEQTSPSLIQVYQFKGRPMCYKIIAVMDNTAAVVFDTLCDLDARSSWDPMCVEARVVEKVSNPPGTTVQYIRTKAVWPTASRDTVVLGTVRDLGDGRLFTVNSSIEHEATPERVKEKIVRMETAVAGHIITSESDAPNKCRLVQILDADLKGWIPEKVIQMVSTKAVPDGMRNVNKLVPSISPYNESKVLAAVAAANRALAGIADPEQQNNENTDGPNNEAPEIIQRNQTKQDQTTHELRKRRDSTSITLAVLSDRLRAVESEIGIGRSSEERRHRSRERREPRRQGNKGQESGSKALEKQKAEPASAFGVFWEGLKQTFGFGKASSTSSSGSSSSTSASGKVNRVLVAVIVVAVLGSTAAAKFRRR